MAITAPSQQTQTEPRLSFHLSDPGFSNLHRAGLAGLYMSLKALENRIDKPNGLHWELTQRSVSLFWNCSDKEAISWLLAQSFRIDSDGLMDFAALQPCKLKLKDGSKLVIHEGILGTFLQHGQTRKLGEKKSEILAVEEHEILREFKPISGYKHQAFAELICNKNNELATAPVEVAGWLYPGAAVRHTAFGETKIQEGSDNSFLLLFAPITCQYFQLRSVLRDRRAQFSLIIPDISDLEDYWRVRTHMAVFDWKKSFASSAGDAALHWMTHTQADTVFSKFKKVVHCQIHIFGTLAWSTQQKSRTQVFNIAIDKKISGQYRLIARYLGNQAKTSKKGEAWIDVSIARELFAQNLILNRPWYRDFSILGISKDRFSKLAYEKEGLYKMVKEPGLWDRESEYQFVMTCHEALRRRYGQLGERARREGISFENLFQRENEKFRSSIQRCKNVQSLREFLTDFWSRAGSLPTLGKHWQDIWPLLDNKNWRSAKDLALLALASYKRSEIDSGEQESAN